jgi:hypothetical protein
MFTGVNRPECEGSNSLPPSAEVKNEWSYISVSSTCLRGLNRTTYPHLQLASLRLTTNGTVTRHQLSGTHCDGVSISRLSLDFPSGHCRQRSNPQANNSDKRRKRLFLCWRDPERLSVVQTNPAFPRRKVLGWRGVK